VSRSACEVSVAMSCGDAGSAPCMQQLWAGCVPAHSLPYVMRRRDHDWLLACCALLSRFVPCAAVLLCVLCPWRVLMSLLHTHSYPQAPP
jgi:hypothetical protein